MKTQFLSALSLLVLVAGCGPQASTDRDNVRARETNAATAAPDNSAKNERDRADATLTPGDQGNTPADIALTQKIRKDLVIGPGDYSMVAKNIKIITVNGKVTLRGPVNTAAEKTNIVTIARAVAGEGNVDDQLEVKGAP